MTENGTWTEDHVLASDVWRIEKSLTPMTPGGELEAWRTTTKMLDHLCRMADSLMLDPLILALADALNRSREELSRVEDRLSRPAGAQLGPREEERLRGLMRRSDALTAAYVAVKDERTTDSEHKAETLAILNEAYMEAHEQFLRYRTEVGIPD